MFTTIVVGVDGREGGRDALSLAGRLALVAGGELVAVHALPFDQYVVRAGAPRYNSFAEQEARRMLEGELAEAEVTAGMRLLGDTSPARALHRVAEEVGADVIVVGSTRHGPVGRVLAGDDAVATLHGSTCPVAVAPRGLASREWKPVRSIGVGFDSGPEALQALALATALARACGASLTLRSVVLPAFPVDLSYDTDALERSKAIVQQQLDETIAELPVDATGGVSAGNPVDELTDLSTAVDLLVVGSRSWGPVRRTIIGSTTARLVREAHCPVLVLPRGAATGQPGEQDPDAARAATTAA